MWGVYLFIQFSWSRVLLCNPDWPGTLPYKSDCFELGEILLPQLPECEDSSFPVCLSLNWYISMLSISTNKRLCPVPLDRTLEFIKPLPWGTCDMALGFSLLHILLFGWDRVLYNPGLKLAMQPRMMLNFWSYCPDERWSHSLACTTRHGLVDRGDGTLGFVHA